MRNAELKATKALRRLSGRGAQSPAKPKTQAARPSYKGCGGLALQGFHESRRPFATFGPSKVGNVKLK